MTHGIDNMDSWYRHRLMVQTQTQGIENIHGIVSDSWYSIGTPESHTYKKGQVVPVCGIFSSPYYLFYSLLSFRIFFSLLFVNVIPTISCYLGYFLVSLICPDIPKLFCDPCYFLLFLTFPFMPVVSCCHCYSIHIFFLFTSVIPYILETPWYPF